ncbi:MAG TPA: NUDIX hydrolase [Bryobacteraceae bacterium]|nr:NUDIX hydrolase [Bryobacteraceae bacterium]
MPDFYDQLARYQTSYLEEKEMLEATRAFVRRYPNCFERALAIGHITGSAWILDPDENAVLLTHHRKLNRWLQLGGHCDGDSNVLRVALREAHEESGLLEIEPLSDSIFDVDVHLIPDWKHEPAHFHYDIRYLLRASKREPFRISEESRELAWKSLDEVAAGNEPSLVRMVRKTPGRAAL